MHQSKKNISSKPILDPLTRRFLRTAIASAYALFPSCILLINILGLEKFHLFRYVARGCKSIIFTISVVELILPEQLSWKDHPKAVSPAGYCIVISWDTNNWVHVLSCYRKTNIFLGRHVLCVNTSQVVPWNVVHWRSCVFSSLNIATPPGCNGRIINPSAISEMALLD
jgi:hypothetical protein